jgi:hypothetical protein
MKIKIKTRYGMVDYDMVTKSGSIQSVSNFGSELGMLQFVGSPKATVNVIEVQNFFHSKP